ncbi:MAG: tetratricopeptide repeat protein [Bacteroidetes bacterium]|nr:tetratricopeptide repeat protein [Bacteroidota bacterium]
MKSQRGLLLFTLVLSILFLSGCMSTKLPESYNVEPEVLEAKGGDVDFTVTGTVPEKSFHKKAKVEFTPYLKYGDQTKELKKFTLRGEKTEGEGTVINSKTGGSFTYSENFEYNDAMHASELFVDAKVMKGSKVQEFKDIKLADGIIATYENISHTEHAILAPSGYERETIISEMGTIYFLQNRYNINWNIDLNKADEAKAGIAGLDEFLKKGWEIKDISIDAWASPEGEIDFNDNLAEDRAEVTHKYMEKKVAKLTDAEDVKYMAKGHGEDWDGFMESVRNSNLEDKNTIINVVNSQTDAAKREQEIRNMTVIYKEVEENILPALRRAEIKVNCYEPKRTDEEIAQLAVTSPDSLNYVELLHAATLTEDHQAKYNIYRASFSNPNRDWRAYNNASVEAIEMDMISEASNLLGQAEKISKNNGVIENNMGVVASHMEDYAKAEQHFLNAQKYGEDVSYNLGVMAIQKGEYQKALTYFKNTKCDHNVALAQLLAGNMNDAMTNLKCAPASANSYYMLAVYGARSDNGDMVYEYLGKAIAKDPAMKEKAKEDREFLKYFDQEGFKNVVN